MESLMKNNTISIAEGKKAFSHLIQDVADHKGDEVDIIAPALLKYELINALVIAARRGRIEA